MDHFSITYHAIDRLKQRFPEFCKKIPELKTWKREQGIHHLKLLFDRMMWESKEDKTYINNTANMIKFYERYGYDSDYKFMHFECLDLVFIMSKPKSEKHYRIVTIVGDDYVSNVPHERYKDRLKQVNIFINKWNNRFVAEQSTNQKTENKTPIVTDLIKDNLLYAVKHQKAFEIETITKTLSLKRAIVGEFEYDFLYSKETHTIEVKKMNKLEGERLSLATNIRNINTQVKSELEVLIEKNLHKEDITRDFQLEAAHHMYNDKYINMKKISSSLSYFKLFLNDHYYEIVNDNKRSKIHILSKAKDSSVVSLKLP